MLLIFVVVVVVWWKLVVVDVYFRIFLIVLLICLLRFLCNNLYCLGKWFIRLMKWEVVLCVVLCFVMVNIEKNWVIWSGLRFNFLLFMMVLKSSLLGFLCFFLFNFNVRVVSFIFGLKLSCFWVFILVSVFFNFIICLWCFLGIFISL